jgi:hypothetical protein
MAKHAPRRVTSKPSQILLGVGPLGTGRKFRIIQLQNGKARLIRISASSPITPPRSLRDLRLGTVY